MPKGCKHGARIDVKTRQKSMPKLETKTIMKIIKSHVFLNGKIIRTYYKNNCF